MATAQSSRWWTVTKKRAGGSPGDANCSGPNQDLPCIVLRVFRRRLEARPAGAKPVGPLQVPVRESQPYNRMLRLAPVSVWVSAPMGYIASVFSRPYHT